MMCGLFKRKQKEIKPLCHHKWELIDMTVVWSGYDHDNYFKIGCFKCNEVRTLDEYTLMKFDKHFPVEGYKRG
ncbi:hypothetical protein V7166_21830 [Bacillus thuringiensis]